MFNMAGMVTFSKRTFKDYWLTLKTDMEENETDSIETSGEKRQSV